MKYLKLIVAALLVGISIFSVWQNFLSLQEKHNLEIALEQGKIALTTLEKAREDLENALKKEKEALQKLALENRGLQDRLNISEENFSKINSDLVGAKKAIQDFNAKIAALKNENTTLKTSNAGLKEEMTRLKLQIAQAFQEKEKLQTQITTIPVVKKPSRELKKETPAVSRTTEKKAKVVTTAAGNRGYMLQHGQSTHPAKIKIEVIPAPAKE